MPRPHVNRIATALPPHDVHEAFVHFVGQQLGDSRDARLFRRLVARAGIAHRFSYFDPLIHLGQGEGERFYVPGAFPSTGTRMARFEQLAPGLALEAVEGLALGAERDRITHLVVACCTGFMAPGLDQRLIQLSGLRPDVERTVVGYMGCYAAVTSLRLAHHIVRSDPAARVLVVALELCTLHFQDTTRLDQLLSMLLFGDGCAAALVTANETGLALRDFRATTLAEAADAITWRIGDDGFTMHLSTEVPAHIRHAMQQEVARPDDGGLLRGTAPADYPLWAVHAGGRAILDAVESGLALPPDALDRSRAVLHDNGNMSSATILFILKRLLDGVGTTVPRGADGFGVAFGPGLAAESFRFVTA
ncbi:MAG: type III polyketide synthase [Gemmatimonadetes bacterium]|nr:type III polyketide synthase [Gemmatimonadota bacterium]